MKNAYILDACHKTIHYRDHNFKITYSRPGSCETELEGDMDLWMQELLADKIMLNENIRNREIVKIVNSYRKKWVADAYVGNKCLLDCLPISVKVLKSGKVKVMFWYDRVVPNN